MWETTNPVLINRIRKGTLLTEEYLDSNGAVQHGLAPNDYGAGCPNNGAGCKTFYAVSMPGIVPSTHLTWFQAAAACRNSGRRLATNLEWQMAALGTPDAPSDNGTTDCNVDSSSMAEPTGSRSSCVSDVSAYDMGGNVSEWVADWTDLGSGCAYWSANYGGDVSCVGGNTGAGLPGAMLRGGSYVEGAGGGVYTVATNSSPATGGPLFGFRCVR